MPRVLAIMGSGETAPTLSRVHRSLFDRLGPPPVPAVLIDTPYGFQENADDISGRAMDFFRETVGHPIGVASYRSAQVDGLAHATAVARIREARYVFTGPGSPSYALRQWAGSEIPGLLAEKLATGGVLTFASAAALTLGVLTVPVYEIYKVGEAPHWLDGLDLLSAAAGLRVAVIPHYDNAEGGNHDTRFCYLGEGRLEAMEGAMPEDAFILGVDGHTALVLDLEAGTAAVLGLGGVTVRARGRSTVFSTGTLVSIDALKDAAAGGSTAATARAAPSEAPGRRDETEPSALVQDETLTAAVARLEQSFESGIADRDVEAAVRAVLDLDRTVIEWSRDTGLAGEFDHARSVLRSLIVRLGELAVDGTRDPRSVLAPLVDALVEVRLRARESRDWATADAIRQRLVGAGVEIHDMPDGTTWELLGTAAGVD
jgi:cyanophycinase-like exopeptidase